MTTVVKLGGSLSNDARLKSWLSELTETGCVVIVPGGGPYADAVREQQARWRFSDTHAHRMAVIAMDQFALQLHGIEPRLPLASSIAVIGNLLARSKSLIWLPSAMVLGAAGIATSWDITSDSLAAWLAHALHATRLILVKSCVIPPGVTIEELSRSGVIDRGFAAVTNGRGLDIQIVSVEALAQVTQSLKSAKTRG
jgi:5-(aminomethyl)-3-furanmethanol phosphate kinase